MPERGDLLLVPFPFTDLSASKRRPVLALTASDRYGVFVGGSSEGNACCA
jgi:mRNA interferase MazF